jgi:hypothetical protein
MYWRGSAARRKPAPFDSGNRAFVWPEETRLVIQGSFLRERTKMPWHIYLLQFISGLFLANGVPHFVQGVSGRRFQTPFASPPGVGESSPVANVLWGFGSLAIGFAILWSFAPKGADVVLEWVAVGLGVLAMAVVLARRFGQVRSASR